MKLYLFDNSYIKILLYPLTKFFFDESSSSSSRDPKWKLYDLIITSELTFTCKIHQPLKYKLKLRLYQNTKKLRIVPLANCFCYTNGSHVIFDVLAVCQMNSLVLFYIYTQKIKIILEISDYDSVNTMSTLKKLSLLIRKKNNFFVEKLSRKHRLYLHWITSRKFIFFRL